MPTFAEQIGHAGISYHILQFRILKLQAIVYIQNLDNNSDDGKCAMPLFTLMFFGTATQNGDAVSTTSNLWLCVATIRLARQMSVLDYHGNAQLQHGSTRQICWSHTAM